MLTQARAERLITYLQQNEKRRMRLMDMPLEEALAEINKDGYDFSAEELRAFADIMTTSAPSQAEELSQDQLENVSGGAQIPESRMTPEFLAALNKRLKMMSQIANFSSKVW